MERCRTSICVDAQDLGTVNKNAERACGALQDRPRTAAQDKSIKQMQQVKTWIGAVNNK